MNTPTPHFLDEMSPITQNRHQRASLRKDACQKMKDEEKDRFYSLKKQRDRAKREQKGHCQKLIARSSWWQLSEGSFFWNWAEWKWSDIFGLVTDTALCQQEAFSQLPERPEQGKADPEAVPWPAAQLQSLWVSLSWGRCPHHTRQWLLLGWRSIEERQPSAH